MILEKTKGLLKFFKAVAHRGDGSVTEVRVMAAVYENLSIRRFEVFENTALAIRTNETTTTKHS